MKILEYKKIEAFMQQCMSDSAHDKEHIYRVLYVALDIASYEKEVDYDVLITACLLHDIARKEELENRKLCHAKVGAVKAYEYLCENNYDLKFAEKVSECIRTHRYRDNHIPATIEAKILFDADKIDATGTLGIARTLFYKGQIGEPLYSLNEEGLVLDGTTDREPSFFQEYKFKLEKMYSVFFTQRGSQIARHRQDIAIAFYENMYKEVNDTYKTGKSMLESKLI